MLGALGRIKMSLVFFDFETTGLNLFQDKITQYMFLDSDTQTYLSSYVNPECEIPPNIVKLNGVTWDDLKPYKTFAEQIDDIINFLGTERRVYLVAHNGDSFDKAFLLEHMQKLDIRVPSNWFFMDTLKFARYFFPDLKKHNMQILRTHFGLSSDHAHLATKDVLDLEKIYFYMAKGKTPQEMYQLNKTLSQIMPFGKYKGLPLKSVPENYVSFMVQKKIITLENNYDLFQNIKECYTHTTGIVV